MKWLSGTPYSLRFPWHGGHDRSYWRENLFWRPPVSSNTVMGHQLSGRIPWPSISGQNPTGGQYPMANPHLRAESRGPPISGQNPMATSHLRAKSYGPPTSGQNPSATQIRPNSHGHPPRGRTRSESMCNKGTGSSARAAKL